MALLFAYILVVWLCVMGAAFFMGISWVDDLVKWSQITHNFCIAATPFVALYGYNKWREEKRIQLRSEVSQELLPKVQAFYKDIVQLRRKYKSDPRWETQGFDVLADISHQTSLLGIEFYNDPDHFLRLSQLFLAVNSGVRHLLRPEEISILEGENPFLLLQNTGPAELFYSVISDALDRNSNKSTEIWGSKLDKSFSQFQKQLINFVNYE